MTKTRLCRTLLLTPAALWAIACTSPPDVGAGSNAPFGDGQGSAADPSEPGAGQGDPASNPNPGDGEMNPNSGNGETNPNNPPLVGQEIPNVAADDASCTSGSPLQEDAAFSRFQRIVHDDPTAQSMFDAMTLDEKLQILSGYQGAPRWNDGGAFESLGVERVGYPLFKMRDGPRGVRGVVFEQATTFPVAEVRAASFDLELEERIGAVMAREMRALRADLMLAPTVNVLRHPQWARAQETYGEDPVVLGEMGAAFVRGFQAGPEGMPACPKHFAGNNTDENRGAGDATAVNADIDEQNLRENYVKAFQILIEKSDPACIMAAYNGVNGFNSTESFHLLTEILRNPPSDAVPGFGWGGFVLSDWEATLGQGRGELALNAGMDIEMPTPVAFQQLGAANLENVERAAKRVLDARATFGHLTPEYVQQQGLQQDGSVTARQDHRDLTREAAEKGAVLLKNDSVLPLGTSIGGLGTPDVQSIVFLGPDRDIPRQQNDARFAHGLGDGGSSQTFPAYYTSFIDSVRERAPGVEVTESENAADAAGKTIAVIPVTMSHFDEGEAFSDGGDRDVLDLATIHPVHWQTTLGTGQPADTSRPLPSAFINQVRAADPNVKVVVLLAVGSAIVMEDWIDSADAIVQTFYPGQEGGNAAAGLLFGDVNFSGKLPFTVAQNPAHYPDFDNQSLQVTYEYLHGYRRFEAQGNEPRFWFGHGLSYTSYEYGAPTVLCSEGITESGRLNVEVTVTNTGTVAGDEVVMLFVGSPGTPGLLNAPPAKELKAFARVALEPGESRAVQLFVPARDLRHWSGGVDGQWELARGQHTVFVGPSADPAALQSAPFMVN